MHPVARIVLKPKLNLPHILLALFMPLIAACDSDFSCLNCCCAGFGCCRQSIAGTKDSVAFLSAGGTIVYRNLKDGERIVVDTASVVAIEESVQLGVVSNGRFCMCCCGGEGCFATSLTGPGKVFLQVRSKQMQWVFCCYTVSSISSLTFPTYIQSMNFRRFKAAVQQTIEDRGGGDQGGV
jgi:hypothetical protein